MSVASLRKNLLVLGIAICYVYGMIAIGNWKSSIYGGDTCGYYTHVVSFFINRDVGDYDKTIKDLRATSPGAPDPREDKFGVRQTEKGRWYIKYSLGVGVMETPFFLAAHCYAKFSDKYKADGWSRPYALAVGISTIFYILVGFYLLMYVLARYFPKGIVVLVVLSIAFATNLLFQAIAVTMAHGFLFFDYCLLLYLTVRFYDAPDLRKSIGIGAAIGLITLTRVPEIISVLIPVLWGIDSWKSLKERVLGIKSHIPYLISGGIGFFLVFSIQLAYWYYVSGRLVFNPYQGEGFNFLKPYILNGWFHFRNGWLIYTPIMLFGVLGVFLLYKYYKSIPLCIIAFVCTHIYIHYSYYAWTYFPGFGSRPMVETYPVFALGIGAAFLYCHEKKWLHWVPVATVLFFTALNVHQIWQNTSGLILTDRSNKAFYLETVGRFKSSQNSLRAFDTSERQPNENKIHVVQTIVTDSFEDSSAYTTSREASNTGTVSLFDTSEFIYLQEPMSLRDIRPGDWLEFGISGFIRDEDKIHNRDNLAQLIVDNHDTRTDKHTWTGIKISAQLGNENFSIWSTGDGHRWDTASFFMQIPKSRIDHNIKIFVWNPHKQKIYLDDFFIRQYRR